MNLIIRTDVSAQIGTGHVMRCLALAQAWQDHGEVIFVLANKSPAVETRLLLEGMKVLYLSVEAGSSEDAEQTVDIAKQFGAQWVIVDGYHFGTEYQKNIKKFSSLLFIDDYGHANHYYADLVLNQNISADKDLYQSRETYTQLLLGTEYVLLRREFWRWQDWQRLINPIAHKILVTLGGSDPDNVTLKVIQAIHQLDIKDLEVIVVIGGSNPHHKNLQAELLESKSSISLQQNVSNMPELIAWADVAIAAAGSTSWELAFMGLPSLIITVADNQRAIAEHLGKMGLAINLGWHKDISSDRLVFEIIQFSQLHSIRLRIYEIARQFVDGKGCKRVIQQILRLTVKLRNACESDRKILWQWANDEQVREVSFSSTDSISWEDHVRWFAAKLKDPNSRLYIAMDASNLPIGQVRFDIYQQEATISISVDKFYRHNGYGSRIIQLATLRILLDSYVKTVYAYVKLNNQSSIKAFLKAGFRRKNNIEIQGHQALQLFSEKQTLQ